MVIVIALFIYILLVGWGLWVIWEYNQAQARYRRHLAAYIRFRTELAELYKKINAQESPEKVIAQLEKVEDMSEKLKVVE